MSSSGEQFPRRTGERNKEARTEARCRFQWHEGGEGAIREGVSSAIEVSGSNGRNDDDGEA